MDGSYLEDAYDLASEADNLDLYQRWAPTYDTDFGEATGYQLPELVAAQFWKSGGTGPVLDVGAGTGLVGEWLSKLDIGPLDGLDLSADMLEVAAQKKTYRAVFEGNILDRIPPDDNLYGGAISAGTFTMGHVGPEGLNEIIRVVRPSGIICLTINEAHWTEAGFDAAISELADMVEIEHSLDVPIYDSAKDTTRSGDLAKLVVLKVR